MGYISPEELALASDDTAEIKVLVVHGSMTARNHISRVLSNLDIEHITKAENGFDAIDKLSAGDFVLFVTDLNMPEMGGQKLVKYVRHKIGNTYIPILMATSENDTARLSSGSSQGCKSFATNLFNHTPSMKFCSE